MKEYVLKPAVPAASAIDYKKELNEQQLEVVSAGPGPILVIAGAGSGKTRTLTYRVARLLETGVPPSQILLLTFTNKAAREMLHRVGSLIPGDDRRITGGTFHHVGNLVLRRNAALVGIIFIVIGFIYWALPYFGQFHIDYAGVTMLGVLGIAMGLMFYVLIAGSPND